MNWQIYRGYLLFYVNIRYISLNVLKISVISRVRSTSEIAAVFEIFLVITKIFFSFSFSVKGKT